MSSFMTKRVTSHNTAFSHGSRNGKHVSFVFFYSKRREMLAQLHYDNKIRKLLY